MARNSTHPAAHVPNGTAKIRTDEITPDRRHRYLSAESEVDCAVDTCREKGGRDNISDNIGGRRVLRPSESRLAPARNCPVCGSSFQPNMKAVWSGKGKTCSPRCRSLLASRKAKEAFVCPPGSEEQKEACRAATRELVRRGVLSVPEACACGATGDIEAHHTDYSNSAAVLWLCPKCHREQHYQREVLRLRLMAGTGGVA